jgi:hypothetical protein
MSSGHRWGDSDSSDEDDNVDVAIPVTALNSQAALRDVSVARSASDAHPSTPTRSHRNERRNDVHAAQPFQRAWEPRGRGGGGFRDRDPSSASGGVARGGPRGGPHTGGRGRGQYNNNNNMPDWKTQAKQSSILNADIDISKASDWMATRRAKQEKAQVEQERHRVEQKEAAAEEKRIQRRSQLQALKAAVTTIQQEKDDEIQSSLQAAAQHSQSNIRILQRPAAPDTSETNRSVDSRNTPSRASGPSTSVSNSGAGARWVRASRGGDQHQRGGRGHGREGRGRHGRGDVGPVAGSGRADGSQAVAPTTPRNETTAPSHQPVRVQNTTVVQTASGTVEYRIDLERGNGPRGDSRGKKLHQAELMPDGAVRLSRRGTTAQPQNAKEDEDAASTTSNKSGRSHGSGRGGRRGTGKGRAHGREGRSGGQGESWSRAPMAPGGGRDFDTRGRHKLDGATREGRHEGLGRPQERPSKEKNSELPVESNLEAPAEKKSPSSRGGGGRDHVGRSGRGRGGRGRGGRGRSGRQGTEDGSPATGAIPDKVRTSKPKRAERSTDNANNSRAPKAKTHVSHMEIGND